MRVFSLERYKQNPWYIMLMKTLILMLIVMLMIMLVQLKPIKNAVFQRRGGQL